MSCKRSLREPLKRDQPSNDHDSLRPGPPKNNLRNPSAGHGILPLLAKNLESELIDIGLYPRVVELAREKPLRSEDTEERIKSD